MDTQRHEIRDDLQDEGANRFCTKMLLIDIQSICRPFSLVAISANLLHLLHYEFIRENNLANIEWCGWHKFYLQSHSLFGIYQWVIYGFSNTHPVWSK